MRTATSLLPLLAVLVPLTASAQMGMGNDPPVVDSVTVSPSPAPASGSATIACAAHDTDGTVTTMTITVSGGTLPSSTATQAITISAAASVTGSIVWTTPIAGDYTVTCEVKDSGDPFLGIPASGTLAVPVTVAVGAALPPVIDTLASFDSAVVAGASTRVVAAAHDPAGGPLTWAWSTSGGTLVATGDSGTWTAPAAGGSYTVTLTVSNGLGQSGTASLEIAVAPKKYSGAMAAALASPRRVSVAPNGRLAVVDASTGRVTLLTARGDLMGIAELPEPAIAAAWCWGDLVASTEGGRLYRLDPQGRPQGEVVLKGGRAAWPSGLACDEAQGLLYVAEREGARVRAVWADGTTAFALTDAGAQPLAAPVDLAFDSAAGLLWVLLESNQWAPALQAHAFARGGQYAQSAATFGGGTGKITRGAGIAVGQGGRLFIADAFQGTVEAFDGTGTALGTMGGFGPAPGQLLQPSGLALLPAGDLVVANTGAGRLDRFGTGAALPGCAGDADCDGLPDVWERAYGFNPSDARDAFADVDGDALANVEELDHGTDPRRRDTDGDGYADGEELAGGFNPLDPLDHRPTLVAGAPGSSDPGLVKLDATLQGRGSCQVSWTQLTGPTVVLRDATGASPSFVARQAATYSFQGTPVCQGSAGTPATVEATVREVAPRAEAGRLVAVRAGESFLLDGAFTSDANGGLLSLEWNQSLGPPRLATTFAPQTTVRVYGAGLYSFQLTALDAAGLTSTAEAPVLVVAPGRQAPTAMPESPVFGHAGQVVTLDASASVGAPGAALGFVWVQTAGPAVTLGAANPARPTFVPGAAGWYAFEVSVVDAQSASPAERVEVFVAEAGGALPTASVAAALSGVAGEPLTLDGAASRAAAGGALSYRWRQVSGPAVGLTGADQRAAVAVPFDAGSYLFELVVFEGAAQSVPAFVRVEADVAGKVRPVAVATGPAVARTGEEVILDGSGTSGAGGGVLRYRWTQVAGPWVALDDPAGAQAAFTPVVPGLYTFELEADVGSVRSAPAPVGVLVFPAATGAGGRPR